jgi:tetratricopeptide (TPR) repeat protein
MAMCQVDLELADEAVVSLRSAYALFKSAKLLNESVRVASDLGDTLYSLERFSEAIDAYQEMRQAADLEEVTNDGIRALSRQGDCFRQLKQDEKAIEAWKASLVVFLETGEVAEAVEDARELAWAFHRLGKPDDALKHAKMAAAVVDPENDADLNVEIQTLLGLCLAEKEQWEESLQAYDRAIQIANDPEVSLQGARAAEACAAALVKGKRIDDAKRYFDKAEKAYRALNDETKAREMQLRRVALDP